VPTASLALIVPLAVALAALSVLAAVTGLRARAGVLTRDGRLGVRSPASLASDEAFAVANRVAAPLALGAAAISGVAAVLIAVLPWSSAAVLIAFALASVSSLVLLVLAAVLGDRAARHVPLPARRPADGGAGCGGCGCGGGGCAKLSRDAGVDRTGSGQPVD
jgi:hypothetical protein